MSKKQFVIDPPEYVDEANYDVADASTDTNSGDDGAKKYDLKNISGTPLFPIFDGEQTTMFPNDIITRDMSTYEDCSAYIATFNGGIIVTRIY